MKPITLSKASWHYKLINCLGYGLGSSPPLDLCSYLKILIHTMIPVIILSILGILLGPVAWADTAAWVVASLITGQWTLPDSGFFYIVLSQIGSMVIYGLSVLLVLIFSRVRKSLKSQKQKSPAYYTKQPSFVREIYRKFRDKTCVRITFE